MSSLFVLRSGILLDFLSLLPCPLSLFEEVMFCVLVSSAHKHKICVKKSNTHV